MGKVAPNAMIDSALAYVQACDLMVVCSAEPSSYTDATTGVDLADVAMTPTTDFPIADDAVSPYGRKCTVAAKSAVTIDHTGDATHVALCKVGDTTLRYVTTCTSQTLTAAGTVDIPAWKIQIGDPT